MKRFKKLLSLVLAFAMLVTMTPVTNAQAAGNVNVTVSVEKFVLGQGYVVEPTSVTVSSGSHASDAFEKAMKTANVAFTLSSYGYYLDTVADANRGAISVNDTIKAGIANVVTWDGSKLTLTETDATPESLGTGDYTSYAGWMYSVNEKFPDDAMDSYSLKNGDVIRIQFSLTAGSDVNPKYAYGTPIYPNMASKKDLTRTIATVNGKISADASYLTTNSLVAAYDNALVLAKDFTATQTKVDSAVVALGGKVTKDEENEITLHTVNKSSFNAVKNAYKASVNVAKSKKEYGFGNEWHILTLVRSGLSNNTAIYKEYLKNLKKTVVENKGVLPGNKPTDYARVSMTLTALGKNPSNFAGYNLLKHVAEYDKVTKQGINAVVYAMLALDAGNYNMPTVKSGTQATRKKYLDAMLNAQLSDGGFALFGTEADADITAMVITALAPYTAKYTRVKTAVNKAVNALSKLQQANGSFASMNVCNAESNAWVIMALSTLGINARTDSRFVKNGKSAVDALMSFYVGKGQFAHTYKGNANALATTEAGYALTAYMRYVGKRSAFFAIK